MELVTVGVPTFNRPKLLRRALEHIVSQTYENLEILVSDNASPGPEVQAVISEFAARDRRINANRHNATVKPFDNFVSLLERASGDYFMWAADDDYIEPWFVERCLAEFRSTPGTALVAPEVQYTDGAELLPPFAQGASFRKPVSASPDDRMTHLVSFNYDNLIYGLFRREALTPALPVLRSTISLNEIAPLLIAARSGHILVLPEIGWVKLARRETYDQARWEVVGGRAKHPPLLHPKSIIGTIRYHRQAEQDISSAIAMCVDGETAKVLRGAVSRHVWTHCVQHLLAYKPPSRFTPPPAALPHLG